MLRPATRTLAAALVAVALLSACSAEDSSTPDVAESPSPSASSSSSTALATDAKSHALCSALTNAVASGTSWSLGDAAPAAREVGGVSVPSCEVAGADGDPATRLSVAYLPSAGNLAGAELLAGLCQAVVGATEPSAGGRSCADPTKPPAKTGTELRRADLTAKDTGVLVLSFSSQQPSYRKTSVDDLAAVGQALAVDQLLAMAVG